jgi:hypothetical protein
VAHDRARWQVAGDRLESRPREARGIASTRSARRQLRIERVGFERRGLRPCAAFTAAAISADVTPRLR